jgi:hypothetical protein
VRAQPACDAHSCPSWPTKKSSAPSHTRTHTRTCTLCRALLVEEMRAAVGSALSELAQKRDLAAVQACVESVLRTDDVHTVQLRCAHGTTGGGGGGSDVRTDDLVVVTRTPLVSAAALLSGTHKEQQRLMGLVTAVRGCGCCGEGAR